MNVSDLLRNAGRTPEVPFVLSLHRGELRIDRWLRVLPGKRLVGRGEYLGQPVLAKLFIGSGATRRANREQDGIAALLDAGITTPPVVESGSICGGGRYLLTEFLPRAQTLEAHWDALPDRKPGQPDALALLSQALGVVAKMHARGLLQGDLHLGNFLRTDADLWVIDGDAVDRVSPGEPLPQRSAERNLALFFAQLPADWDGLQELLLVDYLAVNAARAIQPERLGREVARLRAERLDDYLGKTVRDCSLFAVERSRGRFSAVLRAQRGALQPLLDDPDQAFQGVLLKDGGSSTVTRWVCDGRDLLVKRYNIKGLGHWLKRFWRPSRAWHAWQAGHRLRFLGLATPEPLGMVESRFGPLRRRAWLITEFCPGQHLLDLLGDGRTLPAADVAQAIVTTFRALHAAHLSHGDCKGTNFLWDGHRLMIIDLDAMQAHRSGRSWQRAWAVDRARFIRNWPADSAIAVWLEEQLPH